MKPGADCVTSNPHMADFLKSALPGFRLKFYPSAAAFLKSPPAKGLVVIDSSLPDMSGRDLVSVLRGDKKTSGLLLVLTGGGPYSPAAAALSLENGADEYFSFPPDARLFSARLLNLLARTGRSGDAPVKPAEYRFGALIISPEARTASVGAARVKLTALEFDLLLYFLKNQGRVVARTVLLEQVWKQGLEAGPRAVDKRIEALRSRLGKFGSKIRTVFGLGYIFKM
ncbi:MAG: response regulator transcription factor [Elusimicrobiales bacterium]|nr:response regulator transcription factor [Elusimicrobiales bacterium]